MEFETKNNAPYIDIHMNTKKTKPSDRKGKETIRQMIQSARLKKPLTQLLVEERATEKNRENVRKRLT
jgi:hypothetical protein